ncbi:MAG: branched-chain alpha-keto acid dehydrogenase subunit E2 [Rhodobacter sp. BACL10 MAG-120419-bin15]|jgi:pyruvate dehydrogenase E2 component (dihydrolipoamide acetyltransferase)|nr:MAG: branched-chain alpha-keto acid dehydrogenase subunit E2 [Rhodobacter sp. BACL10 MAG-120419-bin15]
MAIEILMPALSPTMEEGTVAKWLVKEGDSVKSGQILAEIETDKATMEFEAVDEGVMGALLVAEGTSGVKINQVIAILLEEGEEVDSQPTLKPAETAPTVQTQTSAKVSAAVPATVAAPTPTGGARVFASPLARRLALQKGLDISKIKGSGPHGRIIRADVEAPTAASTPQELPVSVPTEATMARSADVSSVMKIYSDRDFVEVPLDGMRKTIAARLTEAKQTIPHFYLRRDIKLDALMALRASVNEQLMSRGVKLSVNDFIIKACALALQTVPYANAVWAGDRILRLKPSDVAVAVAIEGGLFTPVLRDADKKSLSSLSDEMKDLAGRAKNRKLAPHEYQGGSFAISNLGMMGVDNFDAVINPPHGAILAVGAGVKKPVVDHNGQIIIATIMSVTLSVDHRVIDGALGAEFLGAIVYNLENPMSMLV